MWYDETSSQQRHLCSAAFTFAQIVEQTIFARISDFTTPEQYKLAQQSLSQLCRELEARVDWDHYGSSFGPIHSCVRDVYDDAAARLQNLAIMQPAPVPPTPQLISREGIVIDREEKIESSTEETDLGIDESPFADWNGR
jgi:hypothetical protein